jgi:acetylornithine deacetylase/succinyl-diaminopimelate desuccinylase-like protein
LKKQPFGEGWLTPPTEPIIKNGKLYGRDSCDDCYAVYSAVLAVKAAQVSGLSHPRIVVTIEGSEEGGSTEDLVYYMQRYKDSHIGSPNMVFCLDASAFLQDSLAVSSTLRGVLTFDLTVSAH